MITELILLNVLSQKDINNISISIGDLMNYDPILRDCNNNWINLKIVNIINSLMMHINKSLKGVNTTKFFTSYLTLYTFIFESKSINKFNVLAIFDLVCEGIMYMQLYILNEYSQVDLTSYNFNQFMEL